MYDISKDYLYKLIAESGIKVGGAKASAVAAIIELIDENALDGLIKSIKSDYDDMAKILKKKNDLDAEYRRTFLAVSDLRNEAESLRRKIQDEKAVLEDLRDQTKQARFDASLAWCNDDEKSRVLAYKAAIEIGKEQFSGRIPDDTMKQILRSASNVAANWIRPTTDANTPTT